MKEVAIYCRVSTQDQHPDNQEIALKDYVERHVDLDGIKDWHLYRVYTDIVSGAKDSRTNLNELMQDARQRKFNVVVFWKVDRLGRSVKHMFQIVEEWRKLGIDFVISTLNIDTTTASGKLIFGILAQIAEFERELTIERVKLSIEKKRKKGLPIGRPKGSKDKKPGTRPKAGYYGSWNKRKMKKGPARFPLPNLEGKKENEKRLLNS